MYRLTRQAEQLRPVARGLCARNAGWYPASRLSCPNDAFRTVDSILPNPAALATADGPNRQTACHPSF